MKIVIAIPTQIEVNLQLLNEIKECYKVEFLNLGIGIVNTTYTLTKYLETHNVDFIVHAGIAGSFKTQLGIGNVVQVTKDIFADFGVYKNGKIIHASEVFPEQKWLTNKAFDKLKISEAKGITLNSITACNERKMYYVNEYQADVETMENAAVFYVCQKYQIPFISLRSVSNYVGDTNKQNWNIPLAVENLWLTLKQIIKTIND